jgi:hypothetical protein
MGRWQVRPDFRLVDGLAPTGLPPRLPCAFDRQPRLPRPERDGKPQLPRRPGAIDMAQSGTRFYSVYITNWVRALLRFDPQWTDRGYGRSKGAEYEQFV